MPRTTSRPPASHAVRLMTVVPLVLTSLLSGGCAPSATSLENGVREAPGVVRVDVGEGGGNDGIPFAPIPKLVTVQMDADASREEVMAVFDAYDEEIADGDVVMVEMTLAGPKRATLSAGEGIQVTEQMVDELVDAQEDAAIVEYRREAHPVLPSVELELEDAGFDEVVTVADRYRDAEGIDLVTVGSGAFTLVRDEVNEDLRVTTAREKLAQLIDSRFGLLGANVGGRGPLELVVDPSDAAAARRLVERNDSGLVGRVVVETSSGDAA